MPLKKSTLTKFLTTIGAKVGTTAGWVIGAANNIGNMATLPAGVTAGHLVVPITGLKVGDTIEGFALLGQIESAGNTATLDCQLRKLTGAAADLADSLVASMTQLSVIADTLVNSANAEKKGFAEVVAEGATYYMLITGTTAASTDVDFQGFLTYVRELFTR